MGELVRLLVINPNTSEFVTEVVTREVEGALPPEAKVLGVTGRRGAPIISCRAENAIAAAEVLELAAEYCKDFDAVLLAVSFDSGLRAAREMLPIPVVGMMEAAVHFSCLLGGRFSLLTFGDRAGQLYREIVESYGLTSRLVSVSALPMLTAEELADTNLVADRVLEAIEGACDQGADSLVLAGAVFAGLPRKIGKNSRIPLVDGIVAGALLAQALVSFASTKPCAGSYRLPDAKDLKNLGEGLTAYYESL